MSKRQRRWPQEFKLRAIARMDEAENITALAEELGVSRELMYLWRRKYRAGGADALRRTGRPLNLDRPIDEVFAPPPPGADGMEQRRIAELERKIGQQQLDLDFFRAALLRVREQRPTKGVPGGKTSSR